MPLPATFPCFMFFFHSLPHQESVSAQQQPQATAAAQRMSSSQDTRREGPISHKHLTVPVKKTPVACTFFIEHYYYGYCWIEK